MELHPLATFFPPLEGKDFELLKQDIQRNGQLEPIMLYDGKILDGANRYRACVELGIEPKTQELNGGSPEAYVISQNLRRRHLNESQLAIMAITDAPEMMSAELAKIYGISQRIIHRAKRVQREAPELMEDVRLGRTTVGTIDTSLAEKKARKRMSDSRTKENKKKRQTTPREVKTYLNALSKYEKAIREAEDVAKYGKFSPEAIRFTIRKHKKLLEQLAKFDKLLEEVCDG